MADEAKSSSPHWYGALWDFLMAHRALAEASGHAPAAQAPAQDNSMVARAAQDAGERMEAEKRSKAALMNANRVKGPTQ